MKTEQYVIRGGVAVPLNSVRETERGKYAAPKGGDVVVMPRKWWPIPRRIAFYPENSTAAWPLGADAAIQPDAMKPEDYLNLYGPYPPTLLRRAAQGLVAEFEKFRLKDWILIGVGLLAAGGALAAAYYSWKLWKLVGN